MVKKRGQASLDFLSTYGWAFLVILVVISGLALLFPEIIIEKVFEISGIRLTTFLHSFAGFFIFYSKA
jgi:thiosulfate reductase cytochrome b subunit